MRNLKKSRRKNKMRERKIKRTPTCGNEKEVRSERDHLFTFM
jgi:hypothetical protein